MLAMRNVPLPPSPSPSTRTVPHTVMCLTTPGGVDAPHARGERALAAVGALHEEDAHGGGAVDARPRARVAGAPHRVNTKEYYRCAAPLEPWVGGLQVRGAGTVGA